MNKSSATFTGLDPNLAYEATVGTQTLSTGMLGPVSTRVAILAATTPGSSSNTSTKIIAVSVVVVVLIVTVAVVVVILNRSRCSTKLGLTDDLNR